MDADQQGPCRHACTHTEWIWEASTDSGVWPRERQINRRGMVPLRVGPDSVLYFISFLGQHAHAAAMGGRRMLTQSLAAELGPQVPATY